MNAIGIKVFMLSDKMAALVRRADDFLDEMERRGCLLDAGESERLAELLVHIGADRRDEAEAAMRRLETLLATHVPMRGRSAPTDVPAIEEYRALLKLVRNG